MAVTEASVSLDRSTFEEIQRSLVELGLDGWLLYDFRGNNPVVAGVLGLPAMTRRYFVLLPARGEAIALTHRIEQQPWRSWIGQNRTYLSWRELESELRRLLDGRGTVAMEYSEEDSVPYVDRVPAGVIELVRAAGANIRSSADLVSTFYSRWSQEGLASHLRAAAVLHETAHAAFGRIGEELARGESPTEFTIRAWIREEFARRGLAVGADAIVAVNDNAANPHYAPSADAHSAIGRGDVVLIDLWGKETEMSVYADQTWMAYVGSEVPERLRTIWEAVRDAREAAVSLATELWSAGAPVTGAALDDAARGIIEARGYGEHFIHRTGHSIDTELHGSGPNLDNLETRDTRRLIVGIGFSVEPGIYLTDDVGFRSEVDVHVGEEGPRVTTPEPQRDLVLIRA
jgi:Xaa-Pro aminopeptidase